MVCVLIEKTDEVFLSKLAKIFTLFITRAVISLFSSNYLFQTLDHSFIKLTMIKKA